MNDETETLDESSPTLTIVRGDETTEPSCDGNVASHSFAEATNWYEARSSRVQCRAWLVEWLLAANDAERAHRMRHVQDKWIPASPARLARMEARGYVLTYEQVDNINRRIDEAIKFGYVEPKEKVVLTSLIDVLDFIIDVTKQEFVDMAAILAIRPKDDLTVALNHLGARLIALHKSRKAIVLDSDAAFSENRKQFNAFLRIKRLYNALKVEITNQASKPKVVSSDDNKKSPVRKIYKKRKVDPFKRIKSLKYKREDADLKIKSVSPTSLVGAKEAWLVNTRYGTLTKLVAAVGYDLDVKGTSVINFDDKESITKRAGRRIEEILSSVMNDGKVARRKVFDTIKTQPIKVQNRCGNDTVILLTSK